MISWNRDSTFQGKWFIQQFGYFHFSSLKNSIGVPVTPQTPPSDAVNPWFSDKDTEFFPCLAVPPSGDRVPIFVYSDSWKMILLGDFIIPILTSPSIVFSFIASRSYFSQKGNVISAMTFDLSFGEPSARLFIQANLRIITSGFGTYIACWKGDFASIATPTTMTLF